jgi:hypothetical protein
MKNFKPEIEEKTLHEDENEPDDRQENENGARERLGILVVIVHPEVKRIERKSIGDRKKNDERLNVTENSEILQRKEP